jgi:hypothetical protein
MLEMSALVCKPADGPTRIASWLVMPLLLISAGCASISSANSPAQPSFDGKMSIDGADARVECIYHRASATTAPFDRGTFLAGSIDSIDFRCERWNGGSRLILFDRYSYSLGRTEFWPSSASSRPSPDGSKTDTIGSAIGAAVGDAFELCVAGMMLSQIPAATIAARDDKDPAVAYCAVALTTALAKGPNHFHFRVDGYDGDATLEVTDAWKKKLRQLWPATEP